MSAHTQGPWRVVGARYVKTDPPDNEGWYVGEAYPKDSELLEAAERLCATTLMDGKERMDAWDALKAAIAKARGEA